MTTNHNAWYIERRPDGKYAVSRGGAQRASAICNTQAEAIVKAKEMDASMPIHVERVRDVATGNRDKWRKI
jgi:hypothetical protein